MKSCFKLIAALALCCAGVAQSEGLPSAAPEELGFSPERLARIGTVLNHEIEIGQYPGAIVLIARKGQVVYHEAFGKIDPAGDAPMPKDALFRRPVSRH